MNGKNNSFKDIEHVNIHAFLLNNQIRTETGDVLDFAKYRFMYDVYADKSRLICCMKAAQIGFTTYEILKTAHQCKYEKIDILYVLPTDGDVTRFSGGKTNKILAQNPCMGNWTEDKDSTQQKQFGKNTVYYQGSFTERAALMITAKKLVVDEYDRCKQDIVEQYDSRLQSLAEPQKAFFSNPSHPDFGVDKFYQISDQKKWHINHACGKTYVMDESCVDYEQEKYICPHCKNEITDAERVQGQWIATSQGEWSGYWIPLWIAPWMPASKIAEAKRDKTPEYFANFVAGLPYVGANNALTQTKLENCLSSRANPQEDRVIIGVDTGHNIHYTMMNKQGIFYHGYCESVAEHLRDHPNDTSYDPYTELEDKLKKYKNSIIVADQGGDLIGIRKLQAKYKQRVFLCWFVKEKRSQQIIAWGDGAEAGRVMVDRNRLIQLVVDEIGESRLTFNGSKEDWQPFFNHALNIYRVKELTGDSNEPQYGWKWVWKRKGPDHLFLSLCYAMIGLDKFSDAKASIIETDAMYSGIPSGRIFVDNSLFTNI